jgi:hypothetical protein
MLARLHKLAIRSFIAPSRPFPRLNNATFLRPLAAALPHAPQRCYSKKSGKGTHGKTVFMLDSINKVFLDNNRVLFKDVTLAFLEGYASLRSLCFHSVLTVRKSKDRSGWSQRRRQVDIAENHRWCRDGLRG